MSDDSMRWPGADGSPGLDFAGGGTAASASEAHASSPAQPESGSSAPDAVGPSPTEPSPASPSSTATPPSTPQPARAADNTGAAADVADQAAADAGDATFQPGPAADDTHVISPVSPPASTVSAEDAARDNAFSSHSTPAWQSARLTDTTRTTVKPPLSSAAVAGVGGASVGAAVPPPGAVVEATTAAAAPRKAAPRIRRTRKARLRLARIDPWSVMKTAFLFSIAFGVMMVVITTVLWTVLLGSGALEAVDQFLVPLLSDGENVVFSLEDYLNTSRVVGFSALVAAIDVVILTAVATLVAFLYNMAATLMGGLEVTLAED